MSFDYIRKSYGVPAKRGARVTYEGNPAVITSSKGKYIRLRFDGKTNTHNGVFHPTWSIEYK